MPLATEQYDSLLADKRQRLCDLFQGLDCPELEVYDSPREHFRMRAEFRIWHDGEDCCYAMFEPGQKASSQSLIRLESFPVASRAINDLMPPLLDALKRSELTKHKLYQIEFLSTLSGQMLVTLIYHKKLDEDWAGAARQLEQQFGIFIIGRSRKQKLLISQDYVVETLNIHGRPFHYKQIEGGFTQPNAIVCQKMIEWAVDCSRDRAGDLLELYCGNGNFTLPLAQNFKRVLATEISKTSVAAAEWNIDQNRVGNIQIARLSSEEFAEAYTQGREFSRLKNRDIDINSYQFDSVFVDPPRAGLDEGTVELVQQFDNIIYISCNPHTLRNNLDTLCQSHEIKRFALFDQFPYTDHMESGVWLQRKL